MRIESFNLFSQSPLAVSLNASTRAPMASQNRDRLESLQPNNENPLLPPSPPKSRYPISTFVKLTVAIAIPLTILVFVAKALGIITISSGSAATASVLGAAASSAAIVGVAYLVASAIAAAISLAFVVMVIWLVIQFTKNK